MTLARKLERHHCCNRGTHETRRYFLALTFVFHFWLGRGGESSRIRTINMIRDRPDLPKLVERLMVLIAEQIITEEILRKPDTRGLSSSFWARATLQLWQQTTLWVPWLSRSSQGDEKRWVLLAVTPNGTGKLYLSVARTAHCSPRDS